jgi:hypothetical protein
LAFADATAGTKKEAAAPKATVVETKAAEPETKKASAETITKEQGKQWNDARKASGHTTAEATDYLNETHKTATTGGILVSRFEEAMTWANTPKAKEEPKQEEKPKVEVSGDQKFCLQTWEKLGTNQDDRAEHVEQYTGADGEIDWAGLGTQLHAMLEERNGQ